MCVRGINTLKNTIRCRFPLLESTCFRLFAIHLELLDCRAEWIIDGVMCCDLCDHLRFAYIPETSTINIGNTHSDGDFLKLLFFFGWSLSRHVDRRNNNMQNDMRDTHTHTHTISVVFFSRATWFIIYLSDSDKGTGKFFSHTFIIIIRFLTYSTNEKITIFIEVFAVSFEAIFKNGINILFMKQLSKENRILYRLENHSNSFWLCVCKN